MKLHFYKYHGNGNDFILIDNRDERVKHLSRSTVEKLCHRRFGIGADGLILMNKSKDYDFEMQYYNSDGRESSMCGNGGRCMVQFAVDLGLVQSRTRFLAIDGPHEGIIGADKSISIKMIDVKTFEKKEADFVINTGSPHYVKFVGEVSAMNVSVEGGKIRNQNEFAREGINVNFVEEEKDALKVRTFERGVEGETYSCGTGVVAAALISSVKQKKSEGRQTVHLSTLGGTFEVSFVKKNEGFSDIWLKGGVEFVFVGEVDLVKFGK